MSIEKCGRCGRTASAFVMFPDGTAVCPTCAEAIARAAIRLRIAAAADLENAGAETRAEMKAAIEEFDLAIPPPKPGDVQK